MIDPILSHILAREKQRQQNELEMIASENYVSKDVLLACANIFTNKYSEGYPGSRYYGGQQYVDELERFTQQKALQVFGLLQEGREGKSIQQSIDDATRAVNVQPLSGAPANLAVYLGVLTPGDTVLAMGLDAGGHLTHGHPLNASAIYYNFIPYGVLPESCDIDFDDVRQKALEKKPKLIVAGFSAYVKNIHWASFRAIAEDVKKAHGYTPLLMADISHIAGLIAGGALQKDGELNTPFPYFDIVTTTTHKTLRGPRGAFIFCRKQATSSEAAVSGLGGKDISSPGTIGENAQTTPGGQNNKVSLSLEKQINRGVFPGVQGGPHEHTIYAKAVALDEALRPSFQDYTKRVLENAKELAKELVTMGWDVLTGTTENHMVLIDVTKRWKDTPSHTLEKTQLTGKVAEGVLEKVGISVNKNMLPGDPRSPLDPSGIRIGTPAITTRGLGKDEVKMIASIISRAREHYDDEAYLQTLKEEVLSLCAKFPLRE